VFLAVLSYLLFAAFVIYLQQDPVAGFIGRIYLGAVTLVYALNALVLYRVLYGKKNPFETHADRLRAIGLTVKSSIYSCIVVVVYLSLNFSLRMLDLQRWEPFALSIFFVITVLLASVGFAAHRASKREPSARDREHLDRDRQAFVFLLFITALSSAFASFSLPPSTM
jgi:hypothetical protein